MANFSISTKKILSASNIKRILALGISSRDELSNMELGLISDYDNTKTYTRGQAVYYNNYLYKCLYTTTGDCEESKWQLIGDDVDLVTKADIEAMLGLTQDQLDTLASIILDSQVRLDKTYSSSKIYSDLQQCLNDSKAFTLQEFAKASKASYQVVSATSQMLDKSVIYLMSNGSNYDMYIVESDGTPTKIGDTTIDLSQFYTKTEIDNDFVKKTDADGKYALITTVDGKVDKTSILSTISSTPSNDKLLSEKAIKSELDKKAGIDKISHVSKYVCADSPIINDTMYRLYIGNDNVRFQKFIDFATSNIRVEWDYGLFNKDGLFSQALGEGKDLNDLHMNCFFATSGKCLNIPDTDKNFFGISFCYSGSNVYSTQICVHANENQNTTKQRTIYVRHCYNGTWGNWGTISSTGVKDVGTTTIKPTFPSTVTLGSSQRIIYSIKNGWANVSTVMQFASPKLSWIAIATGLPKPDKTVNTSTVGETFVNANVAYRIKTDGTLEMRIDSEITRLNWWNINVSYPVAQS